MKFYTLWPVLCLFRGKYSTEYNDLKKIKEKMENGQKKFKEEKGVKLIRINILIVDHDLGSY